MSIASLRTKFELVRHEGRANGWRAGASRARGLFKEWIGGIRISSSYPRVTWGNGVRVHGRLELVGAGRVVIGDDCWFSNENGLANRIVTITPEAVVIIGHGVKFGGATIASTESVRIGNNAMLGPCTILDNDFHPTSADERVGGEKRAAGPVVIGDDAWIGRDAIILQGVTVGARAVIGAGAVVRASVPEGAIVVGNPQRVAGNVSGS